MTSLGAFKTPSLGFAEPSAENKQAPFGTRSVSLQAVAIRMKSVSSTKKITSATKLIAATKLRGAELRSQAARNLPTPTHDLLGDAPGAPVSKTVVVPITTDRGLCGGINTIICKYAKGIVALEEQNPDGDVKVFVVGDKGRSQLRRVYPDKLLGFTQDNGKFGGLTFGVASLISEEILKAEADKVMIAYNRFFNAAKYVPTIATVLSSSAAEAMAEEGGMLDAYELEGPDRAEMLMDLAEFQLASQLYQAMLDNSTSEQASKMQAMENATNNAQEMLEKLTQLYNRTRQAAITTELSEIIGGASALEG
ncbi:atp3 gamma subunit of the F1 sector of mitochondrial F1F0 ATP synthase [Pycnococcus provasolii]|uniref:F-ATPase gamma subunit n=1 Tax=Pycnococcus provasolii TaxID=41880 RepID=A0A830HSG1_9CHLO|nr:atp3 gamma subunit of the F1 sector of mitochondrial F1F0 ATP synthase [Pycnococcus provasolii]